MVWDQLTSHLEVLWGGILAFVCFAVLCFCVIRRIRTKPWAIGLLAVLVHALVDYPFARAGVALWFAILLGIASRNEPEPARMTR